MVRIDVVTSNDPDAGKRFIAAVDHVLSSVKPDPVALDCEGVGLSRLGAVEIVSLAFSQEEIFLVDVGGSTPDPAILKALKLLCEEEKVSKIIHDCRMDSDALFHNHEIHLKNVHDTSAFHAVITQRENCSLNDVLTDNGLGVNGSRDTSVYKRNPRFWATRPMTQEMIDWASSDIDKLFGIAKHQLQVMSEKERLEAEAKSSSNIDVANDMDVQIGLSVRNPGRFIGKRGCRIRSLARRTRTLIYKHDTLDCGWIVYYSNQNDLEEVKRAMKK